MPASAGKHAPDADRSFDPFILCVRVMGVKEMARNCSSQVKQIRPRLDTVELMAALHYWTAVCLPALLKSGNNNCCNCRWLCEDGVAGVICQAASARIIRANPIHFHGGGAEDIPREQWYGGGTTLLRQTEAEVTCFALW